MIQATAILILASIFGSVQGINLSVSKSAVLIAVPFALNMESTAGFTRGFFSMFGRGQQQPKAPQLEEFSTEPRGPVSFSANRPQDLSYPFQYNAPEASSLYQQFPNYPGLVSAYLRDSYQQVPSEAGDNENFDQYRDGRLDDVPTTMNSNEVESFFALLSETDEHKCISRLVCEIGADPQNAGEFAHSIVDVFGSLRYFPRGSKVAHYRTIVEKGLRYGLESCTSDYPTCDQESYELVKNMQTTAGEEPPQQ